LKIDRRENSLRDLCKDQILNIGVSPFYDRLGQLVNLQLNGKSRNSLNLSVIPGVCEYHLLPLYFDIRPILCAVER
jgi:hypothetical protein